MINDTRMIIDIHKPFYLSHDVKIVSTMTERQICAQFDLNNWRKTKVYCRLSREIKKVGHSNANICAESQKVETRYRASERAATAR